MHTRIRRHPRSLLAAAALLGAGACTPTTDSETAEEPTSEAEAAVTVITLDFVSLQSIASTFNGNLTNIIPGDYNGDGKTDLLRQEKGGWVDGDQDIQVWLWSGHGRFTRRPDLAQQSMFNGNLTRLIPGDYNGDGKTDILRQETGSWVDGQNDVQVWLSNGNGTFTKLQNINEMPAFNGNFTRLIPGDYDGDGKTDILRQETGSWIDGHNDIQVWISNGNGTFTRRADLANQPLFNGNLTKLTAGDFDADGKTDFIRQETGHWVDGHNDVQMFLSNGNGAFTQAAMTSAGAFNGNYTVLIPGKFDWDGKTDILRQETGSWINGQNDLDLWRPSPESLDPVTAFAPRLRFDGAAPNFPMSAQTFYQQAVAVPQTQRVDNTQYAPIAAGQVPTYYQIITCGKQRRIVYWWFYGYQHACDAIGNGTHNGDWEKVVVTLSEDQTSIAAVTFYMHGKHYTRLPAHDGIEIEEGTHPVVYVGKYTHASFYNEGGSSYTCLPWEEYRNNFDGRHMDSWLNLANLDANGEPWMLADRDGHIHEWGADGVGTNPTREGPSCAMNAAAWTFDTPTWWHSQCKAGDDDEQIHCHHGGAFTGYNYGYDWQIPTTDAGLITPY